MARSDRFQQVWYFLKQQCRNTKLRQTCQQGDADVQAFITATAITDTNQQNAIQALVSSLKSSGLWSKILAIYPMVGGNAAAHKFNLKDPRDIDVAYRLVFEGGIVHSDGGAKPNGINGFANTFIIPGVAGLQQNNACLGYYSREDLPYTASSTNAPASMGVVQDTGYNNGFYVYSRLTPDNWGGRINSSNEPNSATFDYSSAAFLVGNRLAPNKIQYFRNGVSILGNIDDNSVPVANGVPIILFGINVPGSGRQNPEIKQCAFAFVGKVGLSATEQVTLNAIVQQYQVDLARHPYGNDADARAFTMAAGLMPSSSQVSAVDQLVKDLKNASLWDKLKVIYPFVGGTASSHKFNLKDPRNLDAAYRLSFAGGWMHDASGAKPNGTNATADTFYQCSLIPSNSRSFGVYSTTNDAINNYPVDISGRTQGGTNGDFLGIRFGANQSTDFQASSATEYTIDAQGTSLGFYVINKKDGVINFDRNGMERFNVANTEAVVRSDINFTLAAINAGNDAQLYSTKRQAFTFIGDGMTVSDRINLNTIVQQYQATLGRQV